MSYLTLNSNQQLNRHYQVNQREAVRLETRVKRVFIFSFCIGGISEKRENRNKIEPNSPRDLILGNFPLPQTILSVLAGI